MSILNDIIDWVEDKPSFWQIAIDRLIRNNNLTDIDISELKEICKAENGLSKTQFEDVDFEKLRDFVNNVVSSDNIELTKIFNIENINALANSSVLEFSSSGLTVVYGDNGAGKSSFVSILKHICNTRGQVPLINDNLYVPTSRGNDKIAEVEYTTDGVSFKSVKLINTEVSDSILKSVDVFDADSANHYIEGEDEIAFIPQGLSIIEKFALFLKRIETELNEEIHTLKLSKFDYSVLQVDEGSPAKTFLENLNSETTLDELRAQSQYNKTKGEKIVELNKTIPKLRATDPKELIKNNESKIKRFIILKNKFQLLEDSIIGDALEIGKTTLNKYVTANDTLNATSEEIFSGLPISGIGSDSWKQLWESARKFYNESIGLEVFPETSEKSNCPLCLQILTDDANQRFISFEEFIKQDAQQKYDNALIDYNNLVENLKELSFNFDEQEPIINEVEEIDKSYPDFQKLYIEALSSQKDYLLNQFAAKKYVESLTSPELKNNANTIIENIIVQLEQENISLRTKSIDEVLRPLKKELLDLSNEKRIYNFKPKLAREICRQKKMGLLRKCLSKCNTRIVTILSNQLATTYITQNLRNNFKQELQKLGFRNIKIETETKGVRGKQYHFLKLDEPNANNVALKDILSEGEHRCIALSTFFSELSISDHNSSIIFDDPVSSLDHKWRNKISKRIAEESKKRQVIVFTHDITFLLMLQEYSRSLTCDLEIKSLTRKKTETGIIACNPPWDALPISKRLGILKNEYQVLEKIERSETEEVYREIVKPLYGKLRETWERFIEEVFLNGTIQRFGRAIQTQRLAKITDLTDNDYRLVDENMDKCSKYFLGHDSAGDLIEQIPDSAEFLSDITILGDYTKEIRKRRK